MGKKKIIRIISMALLTVTVTSGVVFATTDIGGKFLSWAKERVSIVVNQITVDNNGLTSKLQTDANTKKTESKAAVTEYGKIVGDEKASDLEAYGDEYLRELDEAATELEAEIPTTFDEFVAKVTGETTTSLNNKGNEILKKIESSQEGFGGELWSVQNSTKQIIDRKIRVSSAEVQKDLQTSIQEAKQQIEKLIQSEDATAREEIKAQVDKAYNSAYEKIKASLDKWEVSVKDLLDEKSEEYYDIKVKEIDKLVDNELGN